MKTLTIAAIVLLVPAALLAEAPTIGIYFSYYPGWIYYDITGPFQTWEGYVYIHNAQGYITAAEFKVEIDGTGVTIYEFYIQPGWINLGDPLSGISITGWPPLDGFNPGYNLLMTLGFLGESACHYLGGTTLAVPVRIAPHPDSGGVRITHWPDNNLVDCIGLTAVVCPEPFAADEKSWGAIKAMLK